MRTPSRKAASGLLVLIVSAVSFAACKGPAPARGNRVLLVGNSIFAASRDTLTAALQADGWDPVVNAFPGTTIEFWSTDIQKGIAKEKPDIVVLELGTNDCGTVPCTQLGPYIDELMRKLTSVDAVLWLTVQHDALIPHDPAYVNFEIESAAARWPNLFLVDMGSLFDGHPEWRKDGTHPTAEGQLRMATLIVDALRPFKPKPRS